jgi:electron transfer flavoprotein alpha/beta subunit
MDILVCFKVVPDLDMLSGSEWVLDRHFQIDTSFIKTMINPYDESALELVLKVSDDAEDFDVSMNLTALTLGDEKSDAYLKKLYALRFEKTVRIATREDIRFLPEVTAHVISRYVQEINNQDALVLGRQSGVGDNEKTPLLVAEMLEWPCITQVIKIEPETEEYLKVTSMVDGGILKQSIKIPCVLSVGNAPNSYMRVPTLNDKLNYGKKPIDVFDLQAFNIDDFLTGYGIDYELIGLEVICNKRQGLILEGETPGEKARTLYDTFLRERLERL